MEDGGPSVTARRVAAHRLGFTRVAADYGDPAADQALAADVVAGLTVSASRMHDYLAARTAFFDRAVTGAIDRGVRQIVTGAAGYDGRALRYARPDVRWFEADHPATQRDKLGRLERLGITAPGVTFVEADFTRDPLADRLRAAGLDPAVPSLLLLEGVTAYLEPAVLESVLVQFRQLAAPGSQLAISVSVSRGPGDVNRARFEAAVAAIGEPIRSRFEAGQAEDLLARTGWQVTAGNPAGTGRGVADGAPAGAGRRTAAARRERLRPAGLLMATAGPRTTGLRSAKRTRPPAPSRPTAPRPSLPPQEERFPLSALLSQALVAFTIECDNEAEHGIPHRTTDHGPGWPGDGVWLTSLVMWENCMRYVADEPMTVGELEARARTRTNLDGMRRWGYLTIDGTARKIHKGTPGPDAALRATAAGLRARQVWPSLPARVERRWRDRFGADQVGPLTEPLVALVRQLDPGLPDCLPILGAALLSQVPALPPRPDPADPAGLPLSALLSRALLSFALEYESEAGRSLAADATVLRVLGEDGTRLRDLPPRAGVAKPAASWALGVLTRSGLAAEEPDPAASRGKVARLTRPGQRAQREYRELTDAIEQRWQRRFGAGVTGALRAALEPLATSPDGGACPLLAGLEPYPDNWRAAVPAPVTLPHYPMVLHRGGYPDGS
ncbi:MAG TPA: SAM-dependent methyltransferase [Streptosporangiaceae bacterium]|nr:SAM-dependent methyltransferase [Streptosporangiaceae bacterium]